MDGSLGARPAIAEITAVSIGSARLPLGTRLGWHGLDGQNGQGRSQARVGGRVCSRGKRASGLSVASPWEPLPRLPSLSPLSGQELNNFHLSRGPSNGRTGPLTLRRLEGSQEVSGNELQRGPKAGGTGTGSYHSSPRLSISGSLPREQLMHQAAEDLPEGVDPAHKEVGARGPLLLAAPALMHLKLSWRRPGHDPLMVGNGQAARGEGSSRWDNGQRDLGEDRTTGWMGRGSGIS